MASASAAYRKTRELVWNKNDHSGCVAWTRGHSAGLETGRSTYHNYQLASSAVDQFHMQLNAGDYNTIYDEATDDFRRSGSREDITRFFTSIHEQMGSAGNKNAAGFHVNWRNGRVWVDQVFNTRFEKGQGQGSFVWEIQQERPLLYHYRLDSPNFR